MSDGTNKFDPRDGSSGSADGSASATDLPVACTSFRDAACASSPSLGLVEEHGRSCDACRRWLFGARAVARSLATPQLCAPDALAQRVAIELEEPAAHLARAFGRLAPRTAPQHLDLVVEHLFLPFQESGDLEEWEQASATAKSLRAFRPQPTPVVLDRLVAEELQGSETAQASRYIGRLSHLAAPDELAQRLSAGATESKSEPGAESGLKSIFALRRASMTPAVGGLLAAAALMMIMGLQRKVSGDELRQDSSWAFEIVIVEDASVLDRQTAGMLSALTGATLPGELGHSGGAR